MRQWSVRVEWARITPRADHLTDDTVEDLDEQLAAHAGRVGEEANGNPSAQLAMEARTLRQAFDGAVRAVESACKVVGMPCDVVGAELMTWEEFERRQAEPLVPPLVGAVEIGERLGVTRQRAFSIVKANPDAFPVAARTARGTLYLEASLDRFAASWVRRAGRPPKEPGAAASR